MMLWGAADTLLQDDVNTMCNCKQPVHQCTTTLQVVDINGVIMQAKALQAQAQSFPSRAG